MNARALTAELQTRGFTVTLIEGDGIIVSPSKRLTDSDRTAIRQYKAELLAFLKSTAPQPDWKADCAQLFAEARAQVAINLANGACPDCGGGLVENKLSDERAQYCSTCDFTWRAEDFAGIKATLARLNRQHERQAA